MVECLPQAEALPQPLSWCPSGDRSVLFYSNFHSYFQILHLPVGGQLISSISFEMLGCQPFFFQKPGTWFSPSSGLSDFLTFPDFIFFSFFASPRKYAALCHSASHLLFVGAVQVPGLFFT